MALARYHVRAGLQDYDVNGIGVETLYIVAIDRGVGCLFSHTEEHLLTSEIYCV